MTTSFTNNSRLNIIVKELKEFIRTGELSGLELKEIIECTFGGYNSF